MRNVSCGAIVAVFGLDCQLTQLSPVTCQTVSESVSTSLLTELHKRSVCHHTHSETVSRVSEEDCPGSGNRILSLLTNHYGWVGSVLNRPLWLSSTFLAQESASALEQSPVSWMILVSWKLLLPFALKKNWFPMFEACNTLKLVIRHSLTHQFTKCLQSKRSLLIFSLQVNIVWAKRVSANRAVGKPFTVTQLVKHRWNIYILLKIFCSWIIFAGGELHLGRDPRILDPEKTFSSNIFTTQSLLTLQIFHL